MKRKLKTLVIVILVIEVILNSTITNLVYAYESITSDANQIKKVARDLGFKDDEQKDKSEYRYISKKIKEEKGKYTGLIDKQKENKLNECGMLDEEIMSLSKEEMQMIVTTPVEELYAFTAIYAYVVDGDNYENQKDMENNTTVIELSDDQIDKMYAQEYYGVDNGFDEEIIELVTGQELSNERVDENLEPSVEAMNRDIVESSYYGENNVSDSIKNINVDVCKSITESSRGNTSTSGTYTAVGSTSYLKKTLCATMQLDSKYDKRNGYVLINYTNKWIKMPENRLMDLIKIEYYNMTYNEGTKCTVTHKVYKDSYWGRYFYNSNGCKLIESKQEYNWVTTKMKKDTNLHDDIGTFGKCEAEVDTYDVTANVLYVAFALHTDESNSVNSYGTYNGEKGFIIDTYVDEYTNEQITVQTTLRAERLTEETNFQLYGIYFHQCSTKEIDLEYKTIVKSVVTTVKNIVQENNVFWIVYDIAMEDEPVEIYEDTYMTTAGTDFRVSLKFKYK